MVELGLDERERNALRTLFSDAIRQLVQLQTSASFGDGRSQAAIAAMAAYSAERTRVVESFGRRVLAMVRPEVVVRLRAKIAASEAGRLRRSSQ
jgi:hypothetical protein